ncbi:MAG TPA: anion transporter [Polyangiaceae bacterium]
MTPTGIAAATWIVFVLVYIGLAVGKLPFVHLDRAGIALVGATAALVLGVVTFPQAVDAVDFATIALLFGMMVVVAYLRLGGFFRGLASRVLSRAKTPIGVLAAVVGLSGVLSAFLVNDVVCLALGPIVLSLARRVRRDPTPYLIALAASANAGSTATITGNPQNMIIGGLSHIPYGRFAARLGPIAAIGLALVFAIVWFAFRRALATDVGEDGRPSVAPGDPAGHPDPQLLPKGVVVLLGLIGSFFAGVPVEIAALGAGAVLMLGRQKPDRLYAQIDWNLLVMFAGLFVVVAGFERHVVSNWDLGWVTNSATAPVAALSAGTAVLSNFVSNVPAVLLLKSIVFSMAPAAREHAWLTLAMASTLSGNLTPVASVANLIVLEGASRHGVRVSLWDFCRVGVPVTLLTLGVGAAWLEFVP